MSYGCLELIDPIQIHAENLGHFLAVEVSRSELGDAWGGARWAASDQAESPEDAQRTQGLVRFHAADYHIDPHKIGVLGFSAVGHLATDISTHFERRLYPAVDAADNESCRPDFAVVLYPGHLWISSVKFELNPDITRQTPPTFLVHAENRLNAD